MKTVEIKPAYEIGDLVTDRETLKKGTITRVWVKMLQVGEGYTFKADVSYSVLPLKTSYNQFRVKEKDLVSKDANGIEF